MGGGGGSVFKLGGTSKFVHLVFYMAPFNMRKQQLKHSSLVQSVHIHLFVHCSKTKVLKSLTFFV